MFFKRIELRWEFNCCNTNDNTDVKGGVYMAVWCVFGSLQASPELAEYIYMCPHWDTYHSLPPTTHTTMFEKGKLMDSSPLFPNRWLILLCLYSKMRLE
jgi:hypothetical protein